MSDSEGKSEEIVVDSSSITFSSVGDSGPQEGVRIDLESDSSIEWNDDESSAENWFYSLISLEGMVLCIFFVYFKIK